MTAALKYPIVRLASLATKQRNAIVGGPFGSNLVSRDYTAGGVPVIRGTNLAGSKYVSGEGFVFVTERKADELRTNNAHPGDIVFTQRGTLGQVGIIPQGSGFSRFVISQSQMKMTVESQKASVDYLYYYFRMPSMIAYIENHALQAGVPHINLGILKRFEVVLPPLPTQRKIAAILTTYDDLIETNKRRIALLEKMAEELYREWFVRMRFPGYRKTKLIKGVPEGWDLSPIGAVTSALTRGISPKYSDESERIVINQKCIRDGEIKWGSAKTHDGPIPEKKVLQDEDILVNSTGVGTLGRSAILWAAGSDLACDSHVTICRADRDKVAPLFLGFAVRLLGSYFDYLAVGATGQTELNQSFIAKTRILVPARDLQNQFEEICFPQLDLAHKLRKANKNLTKTRDLLLPRLISGRLSVEDLDIQFPPSMREGA